MRSIESEGTTIDDAIARAPLRAWLADLASSTAVESIAGADASAARPPAGDAVALLGEILRRMGLGATVEDHGRGSRGEHRLDLEGADAGVLVRGRGETLEHVVTRMLEREGQRGTRRLMIIPKGRGRGGESERG